MTMVDRVGGVAKVERVAGVARVVNCGEGDWSGSVCVARMVGVKRVAKVDGGGGGRDGESSEGGKGGESGKGSEDGKNGPDLNALKE